ncbi:hypothetical protein [Nocardia sp. NPDC056564]|uniref:hypothetical protein n=1 Tax=Nocardia sp. NPDC056564 TaxID=3345865 RepID=UPI003671FE68
MGCDSAAHAADRRETGSPWRLGLPDPFDDDTAGVFGEIADEPVEVEIASVAAYPVAAG